MRTVKTDIKIRCHCGSIVPLRLESRMRREFGGLCARCRTIIKNFRVGDGER